MANTNAISQAASYKTLQNMGKSTESTGSSEKDNFRDLLDKATGTESKETKDDSLKKPDKDSTKDKVTSKDKDTKDKNAANADGAAVSQTAASAQETILFQTDLTALSLPNVSESLVTGFEESVSGTGVEITNPMVASDAVTPWAGMRNEQEVKLTSFVADPQAGMKSADGETASPVQNAAGDENPTVFPLDKTTAGDAANKVAMPEVKQLEGMEQTAETPKTEKNDIQNPLFVTDDEVQNPVKTVSQLESTATEKKDMNNTEVSSELVAGKEVTSDKTEVVRVKVAEPFRQVDQKMMEQIADKVQDSVVIGKEELIIQLTPEHLGKIAIKISMAEDGIKVVLNCDNMKTQSLLADKAAGIGKIVEDNMNSPVTVEVKEDGYWNQQKDATDQHSNSRQQEQKDTQSQEDTDMFIQQLRLGLTSIQAS